MTVAREFLRQIVPFSRPMEEYCKPELFERYRAQAESLEGLLAKASEAEVHHACCTLGAMYELDRNRKDSIEKKAEMLLLLNGGGLAVFVPFVGLLYTDNTSSADQVLPLLGLAALGFIFLLASLVIALRIHERVVRHIVGFDELVSEGGKLVQIPAYCARLGSMVIENWLINHRWAERLEVARRCFRNGLVILILLVMAGIVVSLPRTHTPPMVPLAPAAQTDATVQPPP